MSRTRTHEEHLIDQVLMLALLSEMNRRGNAWQEVIKLMKAAFDASWAMAQKRIKGFSLPFWTFRHGAFSKELYRVLDSLEAAGLVVKQNRSTRSLFRGGYDFYHYQITEKGQHVVGCIAPLLAAGHNPDVLSDVSKAATTFATMDPIEARERNHRMRIPHPWNPTREIAIGDLPRNTTLLDILEPQDAHVVFALDDEWFDTLEMMLSPDYDPAAMRKASGKTYHELFSGV